MKRLIVLTLTLLPFAIKAQNLQLHYDFGKERKFYTATFEMFRPDTLGSTFWFIDFDFDLPGSPRSMSTAYFEIAREFYIPFLCRNNFFDQLAVHFEYNDGFTAFKVSDEALGAASFNNIFLAGLSHPVKIGSVTISTQWLVRLPRSSSADFQFTLTWFQRVFNGKLIITGFADLFSQNKIADDGKDFVFLSEPQFWYMFTKKLGVGTELEISKNFPYGPEPWSIRPTLALKWEF